jgi:hypothetical protein
VFLLSKVFYWASLFTNATMQSSVQTLGNVQSNCLVSPLQLSLVCYLRKSDMACGACAKNRARRQQQLAARRERLAQKEQDKIARAAAAQAAIRTSAAPAAPTPPAPVAAPMPEPAVSVAPKTTKPKKTKTLE